MAPQLCFKKTCLGLEITGYLHPNTHFPGAFSQVLIDKEDTKLCMKCYRWDQYTQKELWLLRFFPETCHWIIGAHYALCLCFVFKLGINLYELNWLITTGKVLIKVVSSEIFLSCGVIVVQVTCLMCFWERLWLYDHLEIPPQSYYSYDLI